MQEVTVDTAESVEPVVIVEGIPPGKPWKVHSSHLTFDSANSKKEEIEKEFHLVKIRRRANDTFDLKVRSLKSTPSVSGATSTKKKKEKPKTRAGRRAEKMRRQT